MPVTPHNHHPQHRALAPLPRLQRPVQRIHIPVSVLDRPHIAFLLPLRLQGHEDRFPELIRLQLLIHALHQRIPVSLVFESVLDGAYLVVLPSHEGFDEELAPGVAGLIPVIRPVALTFVPPQRRHVAYLPEIPRGFEFDVFGDVDSSALHFAVALVLGAELKHLVVGQGGQDVDEGVCVGGALGEGVDEGARVFFRIVNLYAPLFFVVSATVTRARPGVGIVIAVGFEG